VNKNVFGKLERTLQKSKKRISNFRISPKILLSSEFFNFSSMSRFPKLKVDPGTKKLQ
jgi:hypothetical protein